MKEGDRFAYDYNLLVRKAQAWTSLQYKKNSLAAFVAGRIGGVTMQRDGKMRNGVAEALGMSSYGKSGTAKFLEGGGKAGLTYYLGAGNTIHPSGTGCLRLSRGLQRLCTQPEEREGVQLGSGLSV